MRDGESTEAYSGSDAKVVELLEVLLDMQKKNEKTLVRAEEAATSRQDFCLKMISDLESLSSDYLEQLTSQKVQMMKRLQHLAEVLNGVHEETTDEGTN